MRLTGRICSARCALQIDVGLGDIVTPEPQTVLLPVLLDDMAAPTRERGGRRLRTVKPSVDSDEASGPRHDLNVVGAGHRCHL